MACHTLDDTSKGAVVLVPDVEGNVGNRQVVVLKERLGRLHPASADIASGRATVVTSEAGRERGAGEAELLSNDRYGKRRIEQSLVNPCGRQPNRVRSLGVDREVVSERR